MLSLLFSAFSRFPRPRFLPYLLALTSVFVALPMSETLEAASEGITAELHIFSKNGHEVRDVAVSNVNRLYEFTPDKAITLTEGASAVLFIRPDNNDLERSNDAVVANSSGDQTNQIPWTSYFGANGGRGRAKRPWGTVARAVGRKATNIDELKEEVDQVINDPERPCDAIVIAKGPNRVEEKMLTFLNCFANDPDGWKNSVYEQTIALADLENSAERIYYQMGNEITCKPMSQHLRTWLLKEENKQYWLEGTEELLEEYPAPGCSDPLVRLYYTEFYLAPAVEAISRASDYSYGKEDRIKIILGSIGSSYNPKHRKWLYDLCNHEIKGDYAGILQGKKVYELVDIISIHYLVSGDSHYRNSTPPPAWVGPYDIEENGRIYYLGSYYDALDEVLAGCLGLGEDSRQNRIKGIWSTEELGRHKGEDGRGAATAIKVMARYLRWWEDRSITAPLEGRSCLWGWGLGEEGTKGLEGMQTMYNFFGDVPLRGIDDVVTVMPPQEQLEAYAYESGNSLKQTVILFPMRKEHSLSVSKILVDRNRPPVLDIIGDKSISAKKRKRNKGLKFRVSAEDPDGDKIEYRIEGRPKGAVFTLKRKKKPSPYCVFKWKPKRKHVGEYQVTFIADDKQGGIDSETITITVE